MNINSYIQVLRQSVARRGKIRISHSDNGYGRFWERLFQFVRNIPISLLVTHDQSLKDESLRTLFAETEAILNSRSLAIKYWVMSKVSNQYV